jgi:hypothetical protein
MNADRLDLMPGIIMALDLLRDRVVFSNKAARDLIPYLTEIDVISELCKKHPELDRAHEGIKGSNDEGPRVSKPNGKCIAYSVNKSDGIAYVTGMDITDVVSAGFVDAEKRKTKELGVYTCESGLAFLDIYLRGVEDDKRPTFTISYLVLNQADIKEEDKDSHTKEFVDVIFDSIRGTDILAQMNKNEFFILFPKCSFEIVNNIIMTIQSKLDLLSNLDTTSHEFAFNYAVAEIDESNLDSADTVIERVRSMV